VDFWYTVYMSWAAQRQMQYLGGILFIVVLILAWFLYPILTKAPTCFDSKKNGNETGVDCGGSCALVCLNTVSYPVTLWSRAFHVSGSTYNLVALVENQNKSSAVERASYEFRIYNTNNKLIEIRAGETYIPPNQQLAVFEPRFDAGKSIISSVSFELTSPLVWVKKAPTIQTMPIRVSNILFSSDNNVPTLTANISNDSVHNLPPFDIIAILYDADHNAINVSKTHKEDLVSGGTSLLLFTWPQALSSTPATEDILTQINPFTTPF